MQSGGNGADAAGVIGFLGFSAYIAFMIWLFVPMIGNIPFLSPADTVIEQVEVYPTMPPVVDNGYGIAVAHPPVSLSTEPVLQPTYTPQPTYTAQPTYTPMPTFTPQVDWLRGSPVPTQNSFLPSQVNWVFSYYYPPLVAEREENPAYEVNCHPDNWIWNQQNTRVTGCKDITASGLPWSEYVMYNSLDYMGGVAVPYHPDTCPVFSELCQPIYPMGAVLRVTDPPQIAGDYLVVDICPACASYIQSNGVLFLDFLAEGLPPDVNFWDRVEVSEVIYP